MPLPYWPVVGLIGLAFAYLAGSNVFGLLIAGWGAVSLYSGLRALRVGELVITVGRGFGTVGDRMSLENEARDFWSATVAHLGLGGVFLLIAIDRF